ncbi:sugar phosphate nucleotidyltransferase [Paenibacillus thiaminolyticus]|uniref:sugar phosphate nucleotidyltransferase n=1 Tax=Paenibacillus thiaminolyticus TaxID=49283 RepID=UPI0035A6BDC1
MRLILLSGGAGKRLWPLSNTNRPKQFLPVLRHEGIPESMLQRVCRQLSDAGLAEALLFSAGLGQKELIQGQVGNLAPILEEPERRDTFPAISLASAYLHSKEGCHPDEMVGVMPVDGYADDSFFQALSKLPGVLERSGADMALLGVAPDSPSDKFGYIVLQHPAERDGSCRVRTFAEKPSALQAQKLIDEGALWNCGVFVFRLGFMLGELRKRGLPANYDELLDMYKLLPSKSFDIEVVERTNHLVAAPYQGRWKDIGTWNSLSEEMEELVSGTGYVCPVSVSSRIINELDIPVSVWKVPNIVVAAGPDGILVTDREASTGIKDMVDQIEITPRFKETWWGRQTVLTSRQESEIESVTSRIVISEGRFIGYHEHVLRKEIWTVIAGAGEACIDGQMLPVKAGTVVIVEPGTKHSLMAHSDLELIESQFGMKILEDSDIIHYAAPWSTEGGGTSKTNGVELKPMREK